MGGLINKKIKLEKGWIGAWEAKRIDRENKK